MYRDSKGRFTSIPNIAKPKWFQFGYKKKLRKLGIHG